MLTNSPSYIIVTNTIFRDITLVEKSIQYSLKQRVVPKSVILIDQNQSPLILSQELIDNPLLTVQTSKKTSVSAARNELIIPEGVDWIVFCDDDGRLDENYSDIFLSYISENPQIEIIAGSILREDTMDFYSLRHKKGGSLKKFYNTKNLMGSNFCVKTTVFNELNRFDEEFGAGSKWGSGEETDFCWKAFFNNKEMEFVPTLKVIHVPPFNENLSIGLKKSYNYAVGKGALVSKWLFTQRQIFVVYELAEMFMVPPIQIVRGILTLKIGLIVNNFSTFIGRFIGILKYTLKIF